MRQGFLRLLSDVALWEGRCLRVTAGRFWSHQEEKNKRKKTPFNKLHPKLPFRGRQHSGWRGRGALCSLLPSSDRGLIPDLAGPAWTQAEPVSNPTDST